MWQRMAFAITVVLLGFSGGVLALFVRGMRAERGAAAGFCFVSALAIVQAWMVASGIAKARRRCSNVRNAFEAGSGAQARFATVMLGGAVLSTTAALTVLPVLIAQIAE